MRQRVLAYVTRERGGRKELLVFDHVDEPEAGTQIPAGRVDPGETLEQCLHRELYEEDAAERWDHVVLGDGDDAGLVFRYRWEPVRPDLRLFNRPDLVLAQFA